MPTPQDEPRLTDIDAYVSELEGLEGAADVMDSLQRRLNRYGIDRFAHLIVRGPGVEGQGTGRSTYSQEWTDLYKTNDYYNIDPVLRQAGQRVLPFQWSLDDPEITDPRFRAFVARAHDAGLGAGVTFPLHGPNGSFGLLTVGRKDGRGPDDEIWTRHRSDIAMIGMATQEALTRTLARSNLRGRDLSDKERDCLLWTARGKTRSEVGDILGLSDRTVKYHLERAQEKLGVYSKSHAVVVALVGGQIVP